MPQPTVGQVHIDRWLTNVAQKFLMEPGVFVFDKVFPVVDVRNKSDYVIQYDRAAFFRDAAEPRTPCKQSQGSGFTTSNESYNCMQWAFHQDVCDEIRDNADSPMDLDRDATDLVTQILRIRMERLWSLRYFVTGIWGTEYAGVGVAPAAGQVWQWSDYTNSNPITDIRNAKLRTWLLTGMQPDKLSMNKCTWYILRDNPVIVNRFINVQAVTKLTQAQVAAVLGLEDIVVSEAVYHNTPEGQTPITMFPCLGNHALLSYTPQRASLMRPSAGYTFQWTKGNKGPGLVMRRIRFVHGEDKDRIEGRFFRDCKVLEPALGVFFRNIIDLDICTSAAWDWTCPPGLS